MAASPSIAAQLLNAIKARKFTTPTLTRLFAPNVDFQAWTPTGHWIASDPQTVGKIIEVWYSPGANSTVVFTSESATAKSATLEVEVSWKVPPDDQVRVLRQVYLLTVKGDKIAACRVYCAGPHTEFPEVDLEKQRRAKGIGGLKPPPPLSPRVVAARAS